MTDDKKPVGMKVVAAGHKVPDAEWAQVVKDAAEYRRKLAAQGPADDDGEPGPRRLASGAMVPRRLVPVVDWTARGRASNKYFGVSGIPTQLLVLHSAECPLQAGFAQSLTNWALTTNVVASWHRFVDPGARVYMIPDELGAWHASEANVLSIGWEQAGYAAYSRAQWTTPDGMKQLDSLAYDMAMVAKRDGIPARWLTNAEVRAVLDGGNRAIKGFCLHRQIDPETRTDPGNGYPYDLLIAAIQKYMKPPAPPAPEKGTIVGATEVDQIKKHINAVLLGPYTWDDGSHPDGIRGDVEQLVKRWGWAYKGTGVPRDAYAILRDAEASAAASAKSAAASAAAVTALSKQVAQLQQSLAQVLAAVKSGQQPPAAPPA